MSPKTYEPPRRRDTETRIGKGAPGGRAAERPAPRDGRSRRYEQARMQARVSRSYLPGLPSRIGAAPPRPAGLFSVSRCLCGPSVTGHLCREPLLRNTRNSQYVILESRASVHPVNLWIHLPANPCHPANLLPRAAVGLEATRRAAPHGVHAIHLRAAALAHHGGFAAGRLDGSTKGGKNRCDDGCGPRGLGHRRDYIPPSPFHRADATSGAYQRKVKCSPPSLGHDFRAVP